MRSDSEMSGDKVRKRLLELLGTDEVCINDRDFMLRLQEKIAEEHQKHEEQKLKHLREQEKKRERKLILEGIIDRKGNDACSKKEKNTNEEHDEFISFEDHSFDSRPNHESFRLKEKMKSELEHDGSHDHQADGDGEDKESGGRGTPRGEASSPSPEEGTEDERKGDEESSEGQEYHTCSFLNRPYSARMEALIKEESYPAMLAIAVELIR